jgi:FKBP-type peptidyl-prolyl cis-trans isomerase
MSAMNNEAGFEIIDYKQSDGAPASSGDIVTVHYKVALNMDQLEQGPWIDNSWDKYPVQFVLGAGDALKGVDIGLEGMRNASTRRLIIPAFLAFGQRGIPGLVPPETTLYFEVYLTDIRKQDDV